ALFPHQVQPPFGSVRDLLAPPDWIPMSGQLSTAAHRLYREVFKGVHWSESSGLIWTDNQRGKNSIL
ncbi:1065_t:CDS:1, partial [Acaulospora colombiana]